MSSFLNRCGLGLTLHQRSSLYGNRLTVFLLLLAGLFFFQARALTRADLFPFGTGAGDTTLPESDDAISLEICPNVSYTIYDRENPCYRVSS